MKPLCGLSLEHNPQVGFGWQQGGGGLERNSSTQVLYLQTVYCSSCSFSEPGYLNLYECMHVCMCECSWPGTLGMTWRLPPVVIPQSRSLSSLWAASCLWPATPVKRTRGETPPFSAASAIPAHSGGLPECQGRVTMATNQPSTMESRSTGGTRSSYDVMLVYWLKWWERDEWKCNVGHAECSPDSLFTVCCMQSFV